MAESSGRGYNSRMSVSQPSDVPFPADEEPYVDPVIEAYKKDVDRTLIRENLRLTVDERLQNLEALLRDAEEMRRAMAATSRQPAAGT